ncbi:MAG: hypothetical protein AAB668_01325 [Patescibacteria group bacterium]
MSRIVLIHGFATGIGYSIFRPAYGADAGFSAFRPDIESGQAKAFRWDIKESASFFQSINPFYTWNVYRREKKIANDPDTYRKLHAFLMAEEPELIVCHSMGCFLFLAYLAHEKLPTSVRRIIFNQADVPSIGVTLSTEIEERIRKGALSITNTFCFWDTTLWFSAVIHGSIKAGLVGWEHPLIQNSLFSLLKPMNLHTAAIRSFRFRRLVADERPALV